MNKIISYILTKFPNADSFFKDNDRREIIRGAGTTLILKTAGLVFLYGFNILLARLYGAEVLGIFVLSVTLINIFSLLATMGTRTSMVRFVAQYAGSDSTAVKQIYNKTLYMVIPVSIFFCVLFYLTSPFIANVIFRKPVLTTPFRITSFALPFTAITGINSAALRGLKKIKQAFIFTTVLPPFLNTIGLIIFTYFISRSYVTPVYANLITILTGGIYSYILWQKSKTKLLHKSTEQSASLSIKEIFRISAPMFMTSAMLLIMGWTDTFMLGIFKNTHEVGIYRIAVQVSLLISFTLSAINSIAAPKFSELFWKNEMEKLKDITAFTSKFIFFSALPVFIIVVIFSKYILFMFGREFIAASTALIILSSGQLINALCGSVGFFLNMTGSQKIFMNAIIAGGVLNILLNLLLIPKFGIQGAAFATALSTGGWNIFASVKLYKIHGFWVGYLPGSRRYLS